MLELKKDDYEILLEAVLKVPFNTLMARSIISHHVDGKVFVDCYKNPQTFYIIHPYGMTFLFGKSDNELFNQELFDYFKMSSSSREGDHWLQVFPIEWDNVLSKLISKEIAIKYSRLNFKFDSAKFYEKYDKIDKTQYKIMPTPAEMLFEISGSVVPKDYWSCPRQFSQMAKAFTVIIDGKPASTAFTSARHDDKLEIGIETSKEHHGKGLAYLACGSLIEYCLEEGLEPVWSCRYENVASVKLAEKLGFVEILKTPYYHIPII